MTAPIPRDLSAEQGVLGALLLRPELLGAIECETEDFHDPRNRAVWEAMSALHADAIAIDQLTLEVRLRKMRRLDAIGGLSYIAELALATPTPDNIDHYLATIREHTTTRRVLLALSEVQARAGRDEYSGGDLLDHAIAELSRVGRPSDDVAARSTELARAAATDVFASLKRREAGEQVYAGVPSGLRPLDEFTGGFPIGELTLVGGLPGSGKSTFILNCATYAAAAGYGAHVFSYEDALRKFGLRLLGREARVDIERIRALELGVAECRQIMAASNALVDEPNFLLEQVTGRKAEDVVRRVRGRARDNGTRVVFVDYVQVMPAPSRGMKKHEAIDENLAILGDLAARDGLAVVVMSQLNEPKREEWAKWRPYAGEFFGSRGTKQKAKLMLGLKFLADHVDDAPASKLELHVLKNSDGQVGIRDVHYERPFALIHGG